MPRLSLLTWIGNAAAVLLGRHGDVTAQAHEAGCSRQAAYEHAAKVQQAVADAQLPGPSRAELLQENRRLQAELAALRRQHPDTVVLGPDQRQRLAVTAAALGLSLGQVRVLFTVL